MRDRQRFGIGSRKSYRDSKISTSCSIKIIIAEIFFKKTDYVTIGWKTSELNFLHLFDGVFEQIVIEIMLCPFRSDLIFNVATKFHVFIQTVYDMIIGKYPFFLNNTMIVIANGKLEF